MMDNNFFDNENRVKFLLGENTDKFVSKGRKDIHSPFQNKVYPDMYDPK